MTIPTHAIATAATPAPAPGACRIHCASPDPRGPDFGPAVIARSIAGDGWTSHIVTTDSGLTLIVGPAWLHAGAAAAAASRAAYAGDPTLRMH